MLKRIIIGSLLSLFIITAGEAAVKLKLVVVNPSQTSKQSMPVKFDLPKGVGPEDIIDIADMELRYDFDQEAYYVYQSVTLEPSEKLVLEVSLKDIWIIPAEQVNFLRDHTKQLADKLKQTKHSETGVALSGKIIGGLDKIAKKQDDSALLTRDKMNLYYENIGILANIGKDIGMLENLVIDIGGIVEDRVEVPATLAVSVGSAEEFENEPEVELNIQVSNPSEKRKQIAPVRYGLPEEITPQYIVDAAGLDVAYDFNKECFYVYDDAVELEPLETKVFLVKVKDIWRIPEVELQALDSHTNNLMLLLEGTQYFNQAKSLADKVSFNLSEIDKYQSIKAAAAEHIAYYRSNILTLEEVKQYISQLEKIVTQSGSTPGVTITKAERLKGGGTEVKRETGYEGLRLIAESIFRGKAPTVATTWKIIFIILGFVGIIGGLFFILWYLQVKRRQKRQ